MQNLTQRLERRLRLAAADRRNHQRLQQLARAVAAHVPPHADQAPVVVFRASTGLLRLSQNSAFSLLTAWGLRLSGVPVTHFVCQAGMSRCVQGLNQQDYSVEPPCQACVAQAERTYAGANVHWFRYARDDELAAVLENLTLEEMSTLTHEGLPLGDLVLPSLRWITRRHHLPDDQPTRFLLRQYLLSAYDVAREFAALLDEIEPQAVLVFNGMFFPEATARWVARQRGLRVITHEVGFQPYSAFFTEGQATAYPIDIPADFELTPQQNARLDAYLENRFRGEFTMAGIRFWPEIQGLDEAFLRHAAQFRQIVPVFTNVVFDTSQVHANTVFPQMFAWLDLLLEVMRAHPETLFVIRAHPDEMRAGKQSRESVADWVARRGVLDLPNVVFIDPDEYISSYELIQRAKFVMVYNSSIGLEAALLGALVLCGGRARYTQIPTALLPVTPRAYRQQLEELLQAENLDVPSAFAANARRFLYYQLYRTSLPFGAYLEADPQPGFVLLRDFPWQRLLPQNAPSMRTVVEGITQGKPFLLPEEDPT